jgi:hypothetical protein
MKIAIIFVGHVRSWVSCKKNNLEMLFSEKHNIDVYIETYKEGFRQDYALRKENNEKITYTEDDIKKLFEGINVVKISIESQPPGGSVEGQTRKTVKAYEMFSSFIEERGPYDLIVKTRMDLYFDKKIDYDAILNECNENNKLILGCNVTDHINDTFAIGKPENMKKYFNRFTITGSNSPMHSITSLGSKQNILMDQKIKHHIVRLSVKNKGKKFSKCSFDGEHDID